ncbi:MAG: aminodeoxychorismate synthase component I [Spirochaetia bacterium]|nr:aminodeoxychorismate synthase component I [Spirochaetia bacterium]
MKTPFLFIIDFERKHPFIRPLDKIDSSEILYKVNNLQNYDEPLKKRRDTKPILKKEPVTFSEYEKAFYHVVKNQKAGNSYLLNLTFPTKITSDRTLKEIFFESRARYKLYFQDRFIVFSPETFVIINDDIISSYPMKGTIDASIPDAKNIILNDAKEFAEHITIVDLIRNDLSMVSNNVQVEKFRYCEKIKTSEKDLLQISSKITGKLIDKYRFNFGDLFEIILPAGSVTGAPKKKTVEIIKEAEKMPRNYFTGVFGIFDGRNIDSAVMIRYIEKTNGEFFYKSGGGITVYSEPEKEYREMIIKVYVPLD